MKFKTAKEIYDRLNREVFPCLIDERLRFTRARNDFGKVDHNGIALSRKRIKHIETLKETIYHEMLHVFIDDFLESSDDDHHGTIFWSWYFRLIPSWIKPDYRGDI